MQGPRLSPSGGVEIVGDEKNIAKRSRVKIWQYGPIYAALGVTSQKFEDWENRYGMDSLGIASDESLLIPGYPVLSKVAWTYIDHVDLSDSETRALISECEKAMPTVGDPSVREVLGQIRDLHARQ